MRRKSLRLGSRGLALPAPPIYNRGFVSSENLGALAQAYRSLWQIERAFRELKSTLAVRPVFHRRDVNIIGHVFGAFLALRLEVALQKKLAAKGWKLSWPSLLGDLAALKAVQITLDGRSYTIRTELEGDCYKGFQAVGLRPPGRLPDVRLTAGSSRLPRPTGAGRHLPDGSATA